MDGWINEWMNEWMNEWVNEWVNGWMDGLYLFLFYVESTSTKLTSILYTTKWKRVVIDEGHIIKNDKYITSFRYQSIFNDYYD